MSVELHGIAKPVNDGLDEDEADIIVKSMGLLSAEGQCSRCGSDVVTINTPDECPGCGRRFVGFKR